MTYGPQNKYTAPYAEPQPQVVCHSRYIFAYLVAGNEIVDGRMGHYQRQPEQCQHHDGVRGTVTYVGTYDCRERGMLPSGYVHASPHFAQTRKYEI